MTYYRHEQIVEYISPYSQELFLTTAKGKDRSDMYREFTDMFAPQGVVETAFKTDEGLAL